MPTNDDSNQYRSSGRDSSNRSNQRGWNMKNDFDVVNSTGEGSNSLISWRGILAGLFAAIWVYALLTALGFAIGGLTFRALDADDLGGFSLGAAIWIVVSVIIAAFAGSFLASRTSTAAVPRLGAMQGVATTALFFTLMAVQVGMGLGALGRGVGDLISSSWTGTTRLLTSSTLQAPIENALAGLELRRPTTEIVQGLATRLMRGQTDAARNYLAANSSLTSAEIDRRFATLRAEFDRTLTTAQDKTGKWMSIAGWFSFAMLLLGGAAGAVGGAVGAGANFRHPILRRGVVLREGVSTAG